MKKNLLLFSALLFMPLTACGDNGRNEPEPQTTSAYLQEALAFLATRGVTGYSTIPYLASVDDNMVVAHSTNTDYEAPYYELVLEGNVVNAVVTALDSDGGFTVDNSLGFYVCVKDELVVIEVDYYDGSDPTFTDPAGTYIDIFAYADYYSGGDAVAACLEFLASRGVTSYETIPYLDSLDDDAILFTYTQEPYTEGTQQYAGYFYFVVEGNVENTAYAALYTDGFNISDANYSSYGYECVKDKKIEIDFYYDEDGDNEYNVPPGTNFWVYAYADISDEGITDEDPIDPVVEIDDTVVFSELGYENAQQIGDEIIEGNGFSVSFTDGSTKTAYYDTGTAVRIYGGGSVIITAEEGKTITSIAFTFGGSSNAPKADGFTVNVGTYDVSSRIWTGSATEVELTRTSGSGHWRLSQIVVVVE